MYVKKIHQFLSSIVRYTGTCSVHCWHFLHSMHSRVYVTVAGPSVRLSHSPVACHFCGFAAVGPADMRYRSTAARLVLSNSHTAAAACSGHMLVNVLYVVCPGKAASIASMCIMPGEFRGRLSDCGQYCPVSLAENELVDCSSYGRLTYAAEFQGACDLRLL